MQENAPENPRKIMFFFPVNPLPPRSGAQIRCMQILTGLLALKHEVFFISSENFSAKTWDAASVQQLKKIGVKEVSVYQRTLSDFLLSAIIRRMYRAINRFPPVDSVKYTPYRMRRWFQKIQSHDNPDIIWMNYSYNDALIDRREKKSFTSVIDYHDLFSLNLVMDNSLKKHFSGNPPVITDAEVLREDFFEKPLFSADKKELRVITGYDKIVAISETEAGLLRDYDPEATVIHLPVTCTPVHCDNSYDESAVFATGPNLFNLQGLLYFTETVLPAITRQCPEFSLRVTGSCSDMVRPARSLLLSGHVENLERIYCTARFAVCPVLGGTGQQIKVVEAMAHGLPVVATVYSAKTSPIIHGVNGFVARNAHEFARYCIQLWRDPDLCRHMGSAARTTIREHFSEDLLLRTLSEITE
jgi:glycosyltransferase involved in cell wall biosynthesis